MPRHPAGPAPPADAALHAAFLPKPLDPDRLTTTLARALGANVNA